MRPFLGDFPDFIEQATCALIFTKSIQSSCAQPSPCPKGKKPHPNWALYAKDYWLLNLAPTFGQLMRPLPKCWLGVDLRIDTKRHRVPIRD